MENLDISCKMACCAEKGTYTLPGSCSNCRKEYMLVMTRGHEKPDMFIGARCPNCGCDRVS
jgi:hypothetical protein